MTDTLEDQASHKLPLPKPIWLAPAIMLVVAMFALPYGYYTLLRLVVSICAGILAYNLWHRRQKDVWCYWFIGIALLFNPVVPVFFSREIWMPIDIAAAAAFWLHYKKNAKA